MGNHIGFGELRRLVADIASLKAPLSSMSGELSASDVCQAFSHERRNQSGRTFLQLRYAEPLGAMHQRIKVQVLRAF
jgi:hypothetical protein